jgi:glycosyltransferase involved in cell wall biosynthesis
LLYVGDRDSYKNFLFFSRAVEPLLKDDRDLKVICTGSPFTKKEKVFLKELDIFDRFVTVNVNDADLALLYKSAQVFVYPSYYEGFGIPILEALSMGCPVVLSNSSSFPEVAGDAGVYFDPKKLSSIRSAIEHVITDQNYRKSLSKSCLDQASHFSWAQAARDTSDIYRKIINFDHSIEPGQLILAT